MTDNAAKKFDWGATKHSLLYHAQNVDHAIKLLYKFTGVTYIDRILLNLKTKLTLSTRPTYLR